jgi:hypothetical protein
LITLLLHIANSEPVKVDVDELPGVTDTIIICRNPRERTDREVNWVEDGVTTVIFTMNRVNFIEVLPADDEAEEFPLPFRND